MDDREKTKEQLIHELTTLRQQVAVAEAIQRQRHEAVLATRMRQIDAVRAVTTEITRALHLPTLLGLIIQRAVELVEIAETGVIHLWDEAEQVFTTQAWHGIGKWVGEVRLRAGEGLLWTVAQRRQGLIVDNYQRSPYAHPMWAERLGPIAIMVEPLLYRERLIGVITVSHKQNGRSFTAEEHNLLMLFAAQAAIAIENARLFEENTQRQAWLTRILDINKRIAASEDMGSLLRRIAAEAVQLVGADGARIRLRQGDRLVVLANADCGAAITWTADIDLKEGKAGRIMREQRAIVVPDIQTDPDILPVYKAHAAQEGVHSLVSIPITGRHAVIGVLNVMSKQPRQFTAEEVVALSACAEQAAIAIEQTRLVAEVRQQMTRLEQTNAALQESMERLRGMYEIAQAILLAQSPEEIARNTLRRVRQLVPCNLAGVTLIDFTARETMVLAVDSDDQMQQQGERLPLELHDGLDVLQRGLVYMVEDLLTCVVPSSVLQRRLAQGARAYLRVPITVQGALIGSLNLRRNRPGAFTPEQIAIAREVTSHLAVALQQARLYVEVQRRVQELTAIAQVSDDLQLLHPPDTLASQLLGVLEQLLGYDYGAVLLLDDATGRLRPFVLSSQKQDPALWEADKASTLSREPRLGVGITGWVAHTGESVCAGDVRQDPRYYAARDDMRSELCVPLRLGNRVIGVINVESTQPNAYTAADQRVLETVAGQVAIAIQNAQLFEQLRSANARLQALSHQLVNAQETERRAVARELHDEIGQALTAVKINLQGLECVPAATVLVPRLQDSIGIVDHAIQQIRELAFTLRPTLLDDLGLVPALRWYIDRQAQRAGFRVQFVAASWPTRLAQELETVCFRIAQEALTNVVRHAQAHQVRVELCQRDAALHLVIRDDGVGFDVPAVQQHAAHGRSMGLLSMQERALLAGGQFEMTSAPQRGTEIRVRFPFLSSPPSV